MMLIETCNAGANQGDRNGEDCSDGAPQIGEAATRKYAGNTRRGRPFEPGNAGKPKGARNRASLAVEALLQGEVEEITRKCVERAKEGDMTAIRIILDRVYPAAKEQAPPFELPNLDGAESALEAGRNVIQAVARGEMTVGEALAIAGLLDSFAKSTVAFKQAHEAQGRERRFEVSFAKLGLS